jgi:uncharacterized protein YjaG (DUF416 family)
LRGELAKLSTIARCAFATACCERHFPDYVLFAAQDGWGDPVALRETIDAGWAACSTNGQHADNLVVRCELAIPDSEDFTSVAANFGQNAAIMVTHLAAFLKAQDIEDVFWIASLGRDTADAKATSELPSFTFYTPAIEQKIRASKWMAEELYAQRSLLQLVSHQVLNIDEIRDQARKL